MKMWWMIAAGLAGLSCTKQPAADPPGAPVRIRVVDRRGEDLVLAVLAPGLRQALQLRVRRVAVAPGEVIADRLHLLEVEREHAVSGQLAQPGVVE